MNHQHDFAPAEWPFDEPTNVASFTTTRVIAGASITYVAHNEDDGSWEMLDGEPVGDGDLKVVCLGCLFQADRTIGELADLPFGWEATRQAVGRPWTREKSPPEEDED